MVFLLLVGYLPPGRRPPRADDLRFAPVMKLTLGHVRSGRRDALGARALFCGAPYRRFGGDVWTSFSRPTARIRSSAMRLATSSAVDRSPRAVWKTLRSVPKMPAIFERARSRS